MHKCNIAILVICRFKIRSLFTTISLQQNDKTTMNDHKTRGTYIQSTGYKTLQSNWI